jgi:hypothetical protein
LITQDFTFQDKLFAIFIISPMGSEPTIR